MLDFFSYEFLQRALAAGIMLGGISGFFAVFVVQRKMSFLGSGISHAAFGGVALGLLLGLEPMIVAIPFSLVIAFLIVFLKNRTKLGTDTSIGILLSVAMALGIIFLAIKEGYSTDAYTYLFGSILSIFPNDIYIIAALTIFTGILAKKYWSRWAYATFDRELAMSDGIPVVKDEYILTLIISMFIVLSLKIVGILLIGAYLIIPAAAARIISKTFFSMTLISVFIGAFSSAVGLIVSYYVDLPSGAIIILTQLAILLLFSLIRRIN